MTLENVGFTLLFFVIYLFFKWVYDKFHGKYKVIKSLYLSQKFSSADYDKKIDNILSDIIGNKKGYGKVEKILKSNEGRKWLAMMGNSFIKIYTEKNCDFASFKNMMSFILTVIISWEAKKNK